MLRQIDLEHFKCFSTLKLPLRELTLLSGLNASGKSSVIQALALLHQTAREQEWSIRLMLNGSTVRLGTTVDVVDNVSGRRSCGIALLNDDIVYRWTFEGDREDMSMSVTDVVVDTKEVHEPATLRQLLPIPLHRSKENRLSERLVRLSYLTAERVGPQESYPLEDPQPAAVVGARGEHTVSLLYAGRDEEVTSDLVLALAPPTRLRQVEARMAQFFPDCELLIEPVWRANAVTLGIRTSKDTEFHRPGNTGFGITQVLPIIVAAVSAKAGDILMIENPEVHLHPAGQSAMGEFLAEAAAAGLQIILETHSDHVLNGVRRAVKAGVIAPDQAALHFFRPRRSESETALAQVQSVFLDSEGGIDDWPEGFFDQFDKDMSYFAEWS